MTLKDLALRLTGDVFKTQLQIDACEKRMREARTNGDRGAIRKQIGDLNRELEVQKNKLKNAEARMGGV